MLSQSQIQNSAHLAETLFIENVKLKQTISQLEQNILVLNRDNLELKETIKTLRTDAGFLRLFGHQQQRIDALEKECRNINHKIIGLK